MLYAKPGRKWNDLSLADKVMVIQMLNIVPKISQAELAKKSRCFQLQVSRANENRAAILQHLEANGNPKHKEKREGKEVEDAFLQWFVNTRSESVPLTGFLPS